MIIQATHEGEITNINKDGECLYPSKNFSVDYCKRGSTKCKKCKKNISKDEIRIGKSVPFKAIYILQYYHLKCAFDSFRRARVAENAITCMDDINYFDLIQDEDKIRILKLIDETNEARKKPLVEPTQRSKKPVKIKDLPKARKLLIPSNLPSIPVLFTNADQLTGSKMVELHNHILREKPLIIGVCEVKPKNSKDYDKLDYKINGYNLHPVNLDKGTGRGIAVYTHESIQKSVMEITPAINI